MLSAQLPNLLVAPNYLQMHQNNMLQSLQCVNNHADGKGGRLSLKANSKLYVMKYYSERSQFFERYWLWLELTRNSVKYGGALNVGDDTNFGTCQALPSKHQSQTGECFMQTFGYTLRQQNRVTNVRNINFTCNMYCYKSRRDTLWRSTRQVQCKFVCESFSDILRLNTK